MNAKKTVVKHAKVKLIPVRELLSVQAERLGLKNHEIAERLGYPTPNVISMMKSGTMRLPVNKISLAAEVLKIDPMYLAMCVDAESGGGLAELLTSISKRTPITLNEEKLIQDLRGAADGMDLDFDSYQDERNQIITLFQTVAKKESVQMELDIRRIKGNARSALSNSARRAATAETPIEALKMA